MKTVLLIFILAFSFSAQSRNLSFLPKAYVDSKSKVSLADVIDQRRSDIANLSEFEKVSIAAAPAKGKSLTLSASIVSEAIRNQVKSKFESIKIPSKIVVYNKRAELNENTIYEQLLWNWEQSCNSCRLEIKNLMVPKIPKELITSDWRIEASQDIPKGSFSEKIIVHDENKREITYWARGEIKVYKRVPVATRTLMISHKLKDMDVKWEWRDVTYSTDNVPSAEMLGQMQLRQGVAANQIIWSRSVAVEKTVKRGDLVQVTAGDSQWKVSLQGVTEQDGYIGDIINVRNVQTKKLITAEVIGPGEVAAR